MTDQSTTSSVEVCSSPVFIVGSPRSGTTALAYALGSHPELWVSKESYFIHQLFGNGRASQVWQHNQRRATPSWIRHEDVSRSEFLRSLGLGVNALYTSRSGGLRWVDQTPRYTPMIDDLAELFPGAVFVHIIRDGRAVVRSMSAFENVFDDKVRAQLVDEVPDWVDDFRLACSTWSEWVTAASTFAAEHPERVVTIHNEQLASDPDGEFDRVLRFIGVSANEEPARVFSRRRVNSSFGRSQARPDADDDGWSADKRDVFAREAGAVMIEHGYMSPDELEAWRTAAIAPS